MRQIGTLAAIAIGGSAVLTNLWAPTSAHAQRRAAAKLVDATLVDTIKPLRGFVDDPFLFDGAGGRLAYVNADTAALAELRILDVTQNGLQIQRIDLSPHTTTPVDVRFLVGDQYFVVSRPSKEDKATAFILDASGEVLRKFGPADDVVLATRDGEPIVSTYTAEKKKPRRGDAQIRHTVTIDWISGKKRATKKRVLISDETGRVAKLDFKLIYWGGGYTRAVGIKGGSWDAKENQRSPDHEAWYDTITGAFSKRITINNLIKHTKRMQVLAEHDNEDEFLHVAADLSGLYLMSATGQTQIQLAEPFGHYKHDSLDYQPSTDGRFFFTMKIDPVNADAVARKKADPEYLDLYEYTVGDAKARRRARLLLTSKRKHSWRATNEFWVVVPRHIGFDRGGTELQIYKLKP